MSAAKGCWDFENLRAGKNILVSFDFYLRFDSGWR
jgi:hypothetical protein